MRVTEKERVEFQFIIGEALTTWGAIENVHCEIFKIVVSMRFGHEALQAAYWSIFAFENRQKMVDAALTDVFMEHPGYQKQWNTLNNRLIEKNKLRNKLAHCQLVNMQQSDGVMVVKLIPYYYGRMGRNIKKVLDEGMRLNDVRTASRAFFTLHADMNFFLDDFIKQNFKEPDGTQSEDSANVPYYKRPRPVPPNG
jgi:hypothetical protein